MNQRGDCFLMGKRKRAAASTDPADVIREYMEKEKKRSQRGKKIALLLLAVILVGCGGYWLYDQVIRPANEYAQAESFLQEGKLQEAYDLYSGLNGYQDSTSRMKEIEHQLQSGDLQGAQPGDVITFGSYKQDKGGTTKKEIQWVVLDQEGSRLLLVSRYALNCHPYHSSYTPVTWEDCELRRWLNEDFLNEAFDEGQKEQIVPVDLTNRDNPEFGTDGGEDTQDMVFILDVEEVERYFPTETSREVENTVYAMHQGAYLGSYNSNTSWWLRLPGESGDHTAFISSGGRLNLMGLQVDDGCGGVRPALWIDTEK